MTIYHELGEGVGKSLSLLPTPRRPPPSWGRFPGRWGLPELKRLFVVPVLSGNH